MSVQITVSGDICLGIGPQFREHRDFLQNLADALTLDNPEYRKLVRLGKTPFGLARKIKLYSYNRKTRELRIPRGMFDVLVQGMRDRGIPFEVDFSQEWGLQVEYRSAIQLRPYQQAALESRAKQGVIAAPCGAGKTMIGLELVASFGRSALWITHTRALAKQVMEQAEKLFGGLDTSRIGLIGEGKKEIRPFTVGLIQTLAKMDLQEIAGEFGTVIVDECHHVPAATFIWVLGQLPAKYRFGLTATPDRADGLGPAIFRVIGGKILEVRQQDLAAQGRVVVPELRRIRTGFTLKAVENWTEILQSLSSDPERNRLVADSIASEAAVGHRCLVLTELVSHCLVLANLVQAAGISTAVMTGKTPAGKRQEILEGVRTGEIRVLIATRLADEGLDLPELDRLFLATPGRAAARIRQQVGRVMRPAPGKVGAVVCEFIDDVPLLRSQARARLAVYRALGMVS